jgi:hypothetical protein
MNIREFILLKGWRGAIDINPIDDFNDNNNNNNTLRGLSPRANYTDRATAACRRS